MDSELDLLTEVLCCCSDGSFEASLDFVECGPRLCCPALGYDRLLRS